MVFATGTQIAQRIKRQFGDESGVQVTDADILMWLNDAMREAVIQNGSINLKRKYVPAIAGEHIYTLPDASNIASVHSIQYRGAADQPYITLQYASSVQMDELFPGWNSGYESSNATGSPLFYGTDAAGKFKVFPAPAETDGLGFSVLYNSMFVEATELSAQMAISPRYYQYLLEYCLMKAYEMDENWEAADRKAAFIQSTLNTLASEDNYANAAQYPFIATNAQDF